MLKFLENNWLSILSIVIGIIVAYIFYAIQKRDAVSASTERYKYATGELLDVIESFIINKQQISEQVIESHIAASEREHRVILRPACTSISLLQDVALRLQKSRHLDKSQKAEYSEKIESLVQAINVCKSPARMDEINDEINRKVAELEVLLPVESRSKIQEIRGAHSKLAQRYRDLALLGQVERQRLLALATALSGITAALATSLFGSRILENFDDSVDISLKKVLSPLLGAIPGMFLAGSFLLAYTRLKRKTRVHYRAVRNSGQQ